MDPHESILSPTKSDQKYNCGLLWGVSFSERIKTQITKMLLQLSFEIALRLQYMSTLYHGKCDLFSNFIKQIQYLTTVKSSVTGSKTQALYNLSHCISFSRESSWPSSLSRKRCILINNLDTSVHFIKHILAGIILYV